MFAENTEYRTPVSYLTTVGMTRVWIKREDLLPFSFGGNKVRIAQALFRDMEEKNASVIVTYGSLSSNMNRVIAHMAAFTGKKCIAIVKREKGEEEKTTCNERILRSSAAAIVECRRENVRETVHRVLEELREKGEKPYYIFGEETGTGNEKVLSSAYEKVFGEILMQEKELGVSFSDIYLAAGTGATAAGLIRSCDDTHRIRCISVSSSAEKLVETLEERYGLKTEEKKTIASAFLDTDPWRLNFGKEQTNPHYTVTDEYLFGGYAGSSGELLRFTGEMMNTYGIPMDPVYTGKACYGMMKELEKAGGRHLFSGLSDVLFLHTGGIPGYFDALPPYSRDFSRE